MHGRCGACAGANPVGALFAPLVAVVDFVHAGAVGDTALVAATFSPVMPGAVGAGCVAHASSLQAWPLVSVVGVSLAPVFVSGSGLCVLPVVQVGGPVPRRLVPCW